MADYLDTAQSTIDTSKQSLLAAIAQYGSQAKQAIATGQQQEQAQRQAALSSVLGSAQARGAPAGDTGNTVSAPYDESASSLGAAGSASDASMAGLSARAGTYMDQIGASVPALRTQLESHLATIKAQSDARTQAAQQAADARATSEAQSLANQQMTMARLATQQQAAAAKAAAPTSVSKTLTDDFGGQPGFVDYVNQAVAHQAIPNGIAKQSSLDTADAIGQQAGLPAGVGRSLFSAAETKATTADATAAGAPAAVRQDPTYGQAANDFLAGVKQIGVVPTDTKGKPIKGAKAPTIGDILQVLQAHYGAAVAHQVAVDNARALPSSSSAALTALLGG